MWLTLLALRNAIAVLMAALAIVILGAVALDRISVDLFPNINYPSIRVGTIYKGANVQDVEKMVTYPLEKAVSAVSDVRYVESVSKNGLSGIQIWFNWDADMTAGQTEVIQRVQATMSQLPDGVGQPFILKFDITNFPVCLVTVSGGGLDERQLYDLAYNVIEPQIERLPGVASANVDGGKVRQITVNLNRDRLFAKGIGIQEVVRAVNDANFLSPAGGVRFGRLDYNVFTNSQFPIIEPMEHIVVKQVGDIPIRLRDLGSVADSHETQVSVVRVNGERAVFMRVQKQPGANTIEIVDRVKALLPRLIGVPQGVNLNISFDQSLYIRQSISGLWHEATIGGILAFFVILVFLRNLTSTLIISVAIPLSIIATFIPMYFLGQSLNIFTLGGLALAVGRLMDDSIVELEVINRHLNLGTKSRWHAVLDAAREVAMPIFVATVTTIVVFLPTIFLVGPSKLLFLPLTFTISFSLFASFLVSRTVTPLLCLKWLKPERAYGQGLRDRIFLASQRFFDALDQRYQNALEWALGHRKRVIVAIVVIFFLSLTFISAEIVPDPLASRLRALLPQNLRIGTEFFPESDESQFRVNVTAPIGTRVEETEKLVKRLEEIIRSTLAPEEYRTVVSGIGIPAGRGGLFSDRAGPHSAQIQVHLVSPDQRKRKDREIVTAIRPKLGSQFPGTTISFSTGGIIRRVLTQGQETSLVLELLGYDLGGAREGARQIARAMQETPGVVDVQIRREEGYPQYDIVVDRDKAGSLGLTQRAIAQAALFSLSSNINENPSIYTDPRTGNQYNVVVQLDEPFRTRPEDLGRIFVTADGGRPILLGNIAEIRQSIGPSSIERKFQQRMVRITANPTGRDLGSISSDLEDNLRELQLPPGFVVQMGGLIREQREAFGSLNFTALLALVLVYMVMASQFRSLKDPLVVMFSVPMGLIGVLWMLFLTGTTLNVSSFMGIIMMVGIVVSNGVLLVDYTNELRRRGFPLIQAVVTAGRTRLRPIMMTTVTTLVGLLPMAVGLDVGSESNAPLARAVIGGLTVSTVFTLLLIPTLYAILEERFPRRLAEPHAEASGS